MKKIITSLVSAALTTCIAATSVASASLSSITLLSTNAIVNYGDIDSDEYKEIMENYVEFDDSGYFHGQCYTTRDDVLKTYYNEKDDAFMLINYEYDYFYITMKDDENVEKIYEMAKEYPDWDVMISPQEVGVNSIGAFILNDDRTQHLKDAAEFTKKVKEITKVYKSEFIFDKIQYVTTAPYPMKSKQLTYCFMSDEEKDVFLDYIDKLDIDYTIDFSTDYEFVYPDRSGEIKAATLIPNSETTVEERFQLMNQIKDDIGFYVCTGAIPSSVNSGGGKTIKMAKNVYGDANCDGKVSIADSTAILQSIANQDKYGLSVQGAFNGDVYGDYDGISGMDALTIQQYEAGLIDSLE